MRLTITLEEFTNQIDKFVTEAGIISPTQSSIKTEEEFKNIKIEIKDWDTKCLEFLKTSFDIENNDFVTEFRNARTVRFNIPNQRKDFEQLKKNVFEDFKYKIHELVYSKRILSISDSIIQLDNLVDRSNYTTDQTLELILEKLYDLYDNYFHSIPRILKGNGIELNRPYEDRELGKVLEDNGLINTTHRPDTLAQLTIEGKMYIEEKRKSLKKNSEDMKMENGKKIFISHAVKDKEIIDSFVDVILHGALSVSIDEIFCVSTDGTKIKSGDDWRNSIRENLLSAKINFLIITPNYKESEVCLNEMGAAWVTDAQVVPLIIEPINYATVGVIQTPSQIEKILDEAGLDRIKDTVQQILNIPPELIKSDRWTVKKKEFLIRVKKHLVNNPFESPMDKETFNELLKEKKELDELVESLMNEKAVLEKLVNELKTVKDKTEVADIFRKQNVSSQFEEFEELCSIVKSLLPKKQRILNGVYFKSYSRKDIAISMDANRDILDEALANNYIDETLEVKWYDSPKMNILKTALDNVAHFISKDLKEDFHESFDESYSAPLEINNKEFWEEVFDASISFN